MGALYVPSMETYAIIGMLGLCTALSIWAHYKITQIAASQLAGRVQELDNALGEAVTSIFENGGAAVQAQNPLLSLFAEALKGKIDSPGITEVTPRSSDGQFKKLEE
jgi:hypothetical protein